MIVILLILFAQAEPNAKATPAEVSPRTRAILARLDEPVPMEFPKATPLDVVLEHIKRSAKKGPNDPGLPIYIEPLGLQEVHRNLNGLVTIRGKGSPLKDSLQQVLSQVHLAYCVKDDVLIISSPQGIIREQKATAVSALDDSLRSKAVLARLEEPISMPFGNDTPLDYVLDYIKTATRKGPDGLEIPILIIPSGLEETRSSLNSTVYVDIENVPLETTLRLLLKQVGLAYGVRDGRIVIHSEEGIRKLRAGIKHQTKGTNDEKKTGSRPRADGHSR